MPRCARAPQGPGRGRAGCARQSGTKSQHLQPVSCTKKLELAAACIVEPCEIPLQVLLGCMCYSSGSGCGRCESDLGTVKCRIKTRGRLYREERRKVNGEGTQVDCVGNVKCRICSPDTSYDYYDFKNEAEGGGLLREFAVPTRRLHY